MSLITFVSPIVYHNALHEEKMRQVFFKEMGYHGKPFSICEWCCHLLK